MPQTGPRGAVLLLLLLAATSLHLSAPAKAWHVDHDLDLDHDHELDHDNAHNRIHDHMMEHELDELDDLDDDEDDDDEDDLKGHGIKRIRLPEKLRDGDWDADFEKLLRSESPWGRAPSGDNFEDFAKRFSTEHPEGEEQDTLDDWD